MPLVQIWIISLKQDRFKYLVSNNGVKIFLIGV
jgi:hypothetical protein